MHVAALTAYIDSALTDDKFAVELEGLVDQGVFVVSGVPLRQMLLHSSM
jgi:hypothetical protein